MASAMLSPAMSAAARSAGIASCSGLDARSSFAGSSSQMYRPLQFVRSARRSAVCASKVDEQVDKATEEVRETLGLKNPMQKSDGPTPSSASESIKVESPIGSVPLPGVKEQNGQYIYGAGKEDQNVFKGGRAQETLNSRAAMLGFVAALLVEINTHETVWEQITRPGSVGFLGLAMTVVLTFFSSFAPKVNGLPENGLDTTPKPGIGPFTPFAEAINGRSAMLGFVALVATEYFLGHSLL